MRMTGTRLSAIPCRDGSVQWWTRLCVAAVFIFSVIYAPIHIAIEAHHHESHAGGWAATGAVSLVSLDDHGDGSEHVPHLASDHSSRVRLQTPSSVFPPAIAANNSVAILSPVFDRPVVLAERQNPPARPPPDPFQSRAPPRA